ncbi:hypothetical protein ACIQVL_00630 [Streptomyces sp. NPDC090499]|uniref:hypothetical protein n=1 Tax=unclassified Streptomyces TaxID=2593676 RepID=UPI003801C636
MRTGAGTGSSSGLSGRAGAYRAALARTGRMYDGWLPYPPDLAHYAPGLHDLRRAADAGRAAEDIIPALFVSVRIDQDVESGRRALDGCSRATYGMPLQELERIQAAVTGSADEVPERLARYVAAGIRHLVVRLGALDLRSQRDQLDRGADLIPAVRRAAGRGSAPEGS